jgi:hypothetical protein
VIVPRLAAFSPGQRVSCLRLSSQVSSPVSSPLGLRRLFRRQVMMRLQDDPMVPVLSDQPDLIRALSKLSEIAGS